MGFKIYRKTYEELKAKKLLMGVADEGGFTCTIIVKKY